MSRYTCSTGFFIRIRICLRFSSHFELSLIISVLSFSSLENWCWDSQKETITHLNVIVVILQNRNLLLYTRSSKFNSFFEKLPLDDLRKGEGMQNETKERRLFIQNNGKRNQNLQLLLPKTIFCASYTKLGLVISNTSLFCQIGFKNDAGSKLTLGSEIEYTSS